MPLFILYGGEIVVALILIRIGLWILRSGGLRLPPGPERNDPPRGGGRPQPEPRPQAQPTPARVMPLPTASRAPDRRAA